MIESISLNSLALMVFMSTAGDVPVTEARRLVGPKRIVGTFGGSDSLLPGILE